VADEATEVLNQARFGLNALSNPELQQLFAVLRDLRLDAADFS
jgi:hypothetical protein